MLGEGGLWSPDCNNETTEGGDQGRVVMGDNQSFNFSTKLQGTGVQRPLPYKLHCGAVGRHVFYPSDRRIEKYTSVGQKPVAQMVLLVWCATLTD